LECVGFPADLAFSFLAIPVASNDFIGQTRFLKLDWATTFWSLNHFAVERHQTPNFDVFFFTRQ